MNYENTNFLLALKHGFYYMRGSLFSKIFCSTLWQRTDTNIERNGSNLVSVPAKKMGSIICRRYYIFSKKEIFLIANFQDVEELEICNNSIAATP